MARKRKAAAPLGTIWRADDELWAVLVEGCQELGGVDWAWQSFDCAMGKARHGGIESDRTQPTGRSAAPSVAC